jgi:UDP-glucuronate decarboxylase
MNPNDGRVVSNFLVQALRNQPLTIYGDGKQTRSFCYVSDLISAIIKYAETEITEPINIGNPKEFTVLELAKMVKDLFKDKILQIEYKDLPGDDPRQRQPDISKAKKFLSGWNPKVETKEGLLLMLAELQSSLILKNETES